MTQSNKRTPDGAKRPLASPSPASPINIELEEILRKFAPPAEESYHLTGTEPYYAVKESDLPQVKQAIQALINQEVSKAKELAYAKGYAVANRGVRNCTWCGYRIRKDDRTIHLHCLRLKEELKTEKPHE